MNNKGFLKWEKNHQHQNNKRIKGIYYQKNQNQSHKKNNNNNSGRNNKKNPHKNGNQDHH